MAAHLRRSDTCRNGYSPTLLHDRIYTLIAIKAECDHFLDFAIVFERKPNSHKVRRQETVKDQKIERLEAKIENKNDVMAELLEEHIKLKKGLGEP